MSKIALITCRELPEPDFDEELLVGSLREAGHSVELVPWDEPGAGVEGHDLSVLRSCWNYYEAPEQFLQWIDRASGRSRLANDADAIRWNLHKRYLRDLRDGGAGIVPTAWFRRGETVDLNALMDRRGWSDIVVKPAISAGSFLTRRFGVAEIGDGQAYFDSTIVDRDMMVQRYMPAVESGGELALVWIDGEFTHGIRKKPRYADGVEQVSEAVTLIEEERAAGWRAISLVRAELLYARVDLMRDEQSGELLLSELELMEPSLFLLQHRPALDRFTSAITRLSASGD